MKELEVTGRKRVMSLGRQAQESLESLFSEIKQKMLLATAGFLKI